MFLRRRFLPLCVLFVCAAAAAQSFDCSKATEAHEKFICAHRELATADKALVDAYNSVLAQLSDEGKQRMVESQRSWLKYERNTSALDADSMMSSYRGRTERLQKTIQTVGPFKFQSVTIYYADPGKKKPTGTEDDDPEDGPGSIDLTFPRIDSPATPETARWNQLVERHLAAMAKETDATVDQQKLSATGKIALLGAQGGLDVSIYADIVYASPEVISLALHTMTYFKGAAHPNHNLSGYTVLLKLGRALIASDLFDEHRSWQAQLERLVMRNLKADAKQNDWDLQINSSEEVAKDVAEVRRWTISKKGLVVTFSPYEVSSYATGVHDVVVSWTELKPYMKGVTAFPVP